MSFPTSEINESILITIHIALCSDENSEASWCYESEARLYQDQVHLHRWQQFQKNHQWFARKEQDWGLEKHPYHNFSSRNTRSCLSMKNNKKKVQNQSKNSTRYTFLQKTGMVNSLKSLWHISNCSLSSNRQIESSRNYISNN